MTQPHILVVEGDTTAILRIVGNVDADKEHRREVPLSGSERLCESAIELGGWYDVPVELHILKPREMADA